MKDRNREWRSLRWGRFDPSQQCAAPFLCHPGGWDRLWLVLGMVPLRCITRVRQKVTPQCTPVRMNVLIPHPLLYYTRFVVDAADSCQSATMKWLYPNLAGGKMHHLHFLRMGFRTHWRILRFLSSFKLARVVVSQYRSRPVLLLDATRLQRLFEALPLASLSFSKVPPHRTAPA